MEVTNSSASGAGDCSKAAYVSSSAALHLQKFLGNSYTKLLNQYQSLSVTDAARFSAALLGAVGIQGQEGPVQPVDAETFRPTESQSVANHQLRQTLAPPGKHQLSRTAASKLASAAIRGEGLAKAPPVPDTCSGESGRLLCRGDTFAEHQLMRLEGSLMSSAVRKDDCEALEPRSEISSPVRAIRFQEKQARLKGAAIVFPSAPGDSVSPSLLTSISNPNTDWIQSRRCWVHYRGANIGRNVSPKCGFYQSWLLYLFHDPVERWASVLQQRHL